MITARYIWEATTLEKGYGLHLRTHALSKLLPLTGLVAIGFGIYAFFTARQPLPDGMPPVIVGILLLVGNRFINPWFFRRTVRRAKCHGCEMTWNFFPDRIETSGDDSTATFTWQKLHSVTISPDGLLLYPQKNLFHWIPTTAFATPADYATVQSYITASGVPLKRVT